MPKYTGPPTPWTYLQDEKKYTWMKAPRYDGRPMEVGPLARMLVGYAAGHKDIQEIVDGGCSTGSTWRRRRSSRRSAGRGARGMETVLIARQMQTLVRPAGRRASRAATPRTFNGDKWDPSTWPAKAQGYGVPRRAARRAGPLGADRERQDLPLPVRGAEHLELLAARRAGQCRARTRRR